MPVGYVFCMNKLLFSSYTIIKLICAFCFVYDNDFSKYCIYYIGVDISFGFIIPL